jgi:GNAT superfamily N-acetyltransferase
MTEVTHAKPSDAEALANLAEEMDRFYGATEVVPLSLRLRQINEALFSDPPSAFSLLAWADGELVGFAAYSYLWPAIGLTRSLYLKELYVIEPARRQGIGNLLMKHLYFVAVQHGCSRVEWTTDQENLDAQRFYADRIGVPVDESKLFYRIQGEDLRKLAEE